jgi:FtsH-binding integral membrane protein
METRMDESTALSESSERPVVSDAVRLQILSTEHWGLLATRSMIWNEMFTRAGMFVTILSASIVSMAFVAQATGFDENFRVFAILVLTVTLVMGIATMIRLSDALEEDIWLVLAMNRLRHAYLQVAPDLEPYFTTGHHDDIRGILLSVGPNRRIGGAGRILSAIASMIAILNCLLVGAILTLVVNTFVESAAVSTAIGVAATLPIAGYVMIVVPMRQIRRGIGSLEVRFPSPDPAPASTRTGGNQAD